MMGIIDKYLVFTLLPSELPQVTYAFLKHRSCKYLHLNLHPYSGQGWRVELSCFMILELPLAVSCIKAL